MKVVKTLLILLAFAVLSLIVAFSPQQVQAASHPYDVPSNIRSGWNANFGDKTYDMITGKNIVYDVYSSKYINGGYEIVNKNFANKGNQPYLHFTGWAINMGRQHHTSSNHSTYIVAQSGGTTKIYSTTNINISASEDVEYGRNLSTPTTLYNRCSDSARNKSNVPSEDNGCNMEYNNVGFHAYIPLQELFSDNTVAKSWNLYIVKEVGGHVVYTPLILPFTFSDKAYNTGTISLSSGVDANKLQMVGYPVVRRTSPTDTASGSTRGYFEKNRTYTRVASNESSTAVWYGVQSPHDNNATRYSSTAYWKFGGKQAQITFNPEKIPPVLNSKSISGHQYKNGDDYWVRPNTQLTIKLRQYDAGVGNLLQGLNLQGNGVNSNSHHSFNQGDTHYYHVNTLDSNIVSLDSVKRTEKTTNYGTVEWKVTPKAHGHNYDVKYYLSDKASNSVGYTSTGMKIRVDGEKPSLNSFSLSGSRYYDSKTKTYWIKPNDKVQIDIRQYDPHSGNFSQNMMLWSSAGDVRGWHYYKDGTTTYQHSSNEHLQITGMQELEEGTYGKLRWDVVGKTHGQKYSINYWISDNVSNNSGSNHSGVGAYLGIDGEAPLVQFRNAADTSNYTSQEWSGNEIKVRLKFSDIHSGYKQSRYAWTNSTATPKSWSAWSSNSNYTVSQPSVGQWYLHVEAEDYVGNKTSYYAGVYKVNRPPVADFSYSPTTIYNNTTVTFNNSSTDPDGQTLTYKWELKEPNSNSWTQFSTVQNPSKVFSKKGTWTIRLTVSDGLVSDSLEKSLSVINRSPVAAFTYSPTTIYNDTQVSFSNQSSDPDGDSLTYQWAYQKQGSSTWTNFSTSPNPSRIFEKGEWVVRLTVSDGTASYFITKSLTVQNRAPIASFSYSPSTIYNNTTVSFSNNSSDPDGDSVSYSWQYQEPNRSTWVNFSTDKNPSKVFAKKGTWKIKLTASDGSLSHSVEKTLTVQNRAPKTDFTFSPTVIYINTTVSFQNRSSDPDGDNLTYQWLAQKPGSTTWEQFSTASNPQKIFNIIGTWKVKLIAKDPDGASHEIIKDLVVVNRPPVVSVSYNPEVPFEGDDVNICVNVVDPDGHPTDVSIFVQKDRGTIQNVKYRENVASGSNVCYTIDNIKPGRYDISVKVEDGFDIVENPTTWFFAKELYITGAVKHTPEWQQRHIELGNSLNQFYSGERFILNANVTDYPIEYVKAQLTATQTNGNAINQTVSLSRASNILYNGSLFDEQFLEFPTALEKGPAHFAFEVKYTNGVIKRTEVPIEIIIEGDAFDAYYFHRRF